MRLRGIVDGVKVEVYQVGVNQWAECGRCDRVIHPGERFTEYKATVRKSKAQCANCAPIEALKGVAPRRRRSQGSSLFD